MNLKNLKENLKNAIIKTFNKRDTDIKSINKVIDEIEKSEFVKDLWTSYSEKYQFIWLICNGRCWCI